MRTDKQRVHTSVPRNGDKRLGIERRRFSYDVHIPERRSGQDRRSAGVRPRSLPRVTTKSALPSVRVRSSLSMFPGKQTGY
jgi:hypothetical protein